jgi:hypothetical protein
MTQLPLQARLQNIRGSTERARRRVIDHNAMARRVVDHLNRLIANNPERNQQYFWADIARELSLSPEEVERAVMYGGHNGITIAVSDEDRTALISQYGAATK